MISVYLLLDSPNDVPANTSKSASPQILLIFAGIFVSAFVFLWRININ